MKIKIGTHRTEVKKKKTTRTAKTLRKSRELKQARPKYCGQYVDLLRLCGHYSLTQAIF